MLTHNEQKPILIVRNVTKIFNDSYVVSDVSFDLLENETIAIVGENGSGKTVLLNTILNIYEKDDGKVWLDLGEKKFDDNLKKVGYQFQEQPFTQGRKLKRIIRDYRRMYPGTFLDKEYIGKIWQVFSIDEILNKNILTLSGGQKQRVNLFFALLSKPKLLILDEFITGLDINSVSSILEFIVEYRKKYKASMIVISHQPKEIEMLADRIYILKGGRIEKQTTPKEVLSTYASMEHFLKEVI